MLTPVDTMDQTITHDSFWEESVSKGVTLSEGGDRNRWEFGDLVMGVVDKFGKGALSKYAYACNVQIRSMSDYHRVSRFYSAYAEFDEKIPGLSWSHYRAALPLSGKGPQIVLEALLKAADDEIPVEKFADRVKAIKTNQPVKTRPVTILKAQPFTIIAADAQTKRAVIQVTDVAAMNALLELYKHGESGLALTIQQEGAAV